MSLPFGDFDNHWMVHHDLYDAYSRAVSDWERLYPNKSTPTISNGFRNYQTQVGYRKKYLAGKMGLAAEPGKSDHQYGMAIDVRGNNWKSSDYKNFHNLVSQYTKTDAWLSNDTGHISLDRPKSILGHPYYEALIDKYARQYGIDSSILRGMIATESGGNIRAVSPKGDSFGLMQLKEGTFREQMEPGDVFDEWGKYDPETNIRLGAKYFGQMVKRAGGNVDKALVAYNRGWTGMENSGIGNYAGDDYSKKVHARSSGYTGNYAQSSRPELSLQNKLQTGQDLIRNLYVMRQTNKEMEQRVNDNEDSDMIDFREFLSDWGKKMFDKMEYFMKAGTI